MLYRQSQSAALNMRGRLPTISSFGIGGGGGGSVQGGVQGSGRGGADVSLTEQYQGSDNGMGHSQAPTGWFTSFIEYSSLM